MYIIKHMHRTRTLLGNQLSQISIILYWKRKHRKNDKRQRKGGYFNYAEHAIPCWIDNVNWNGN